MLQGGKFLRGKSVHVIGLDVGFGFT